ncbi:hypothetical protein [Streptomyces sp. NRRL B-3229]|uniref:hypothetical protein n=1 Tax=Streptomyces sp. NRRL B-3229 TaxID=1463836 RepID=UPI00131D089D|nr:hypothetical protein [Streptomyces sp. NRRL B-3229]
MRKTAMDLDHFKVYVTDEGLAEINGDPLVPAPGQSVHEAVLDALHRYAEESGAAVDATVGDGPGTAHFVLRVLPDGSSHVLASGSGEAPETEPREAAEPEPGPASEPSADAAASPSVTAAPVTLDSGSTSGSASTSTSASTSAIAGAIARARATAVTGTTVRAPAPASPLPEPGIDVPPAALSEQVGRINELGVAGRLDEAFVRATALRERLTGSVGAEHPHALEARALEAYLAHLRGDHREAVVLALAVARIRCRDRDERAPMDVARAAAAWQQLDDSRAAVTHGRELLHMWDMLSRQGALPPGHTEIADMVRGHVETLEGAYV